MNNQPTYEELPIPYHSMNEDGYILEVNRLWLSVLGYTREEVIGSHFSKFLHPAWIVFFKENFPRFKAAGEIRGATFEMIRKDGVSIWVLYNGNVVRDGGRFKHTHCVFHDITAQKHAEEKILREQAFSDAVLNSLPGIFYLFDQTGNFLRWNNNFEKITEYSPEEIGRFSPLDLFAEPERMRVREQIQEAFDKGASSVEAELISKSGKQKPWFFTGHAIQFEGKPCIVGMGIDISDRRLAECAIVKSEKRFRELSDSMPQVVFEMDASGRLTYVNRSSFSLFGYSQADFDNGLNAIDLLIPEDRDRARVNIMGVLSGKHLQGIEYTGTKKDGSRFPVMVHSNAFCYDNGSAGLRGILIDLTEQKKIEARLQQTHKMEAIGALAGGIAHDFNNILSSVLGYTELALSAIEPGARLEKYLNQVHNAGLRAKDLVRQILTYSRQSENEFKPIQIAAIAIEMLNLVRSTTPINVVITQNLESQSLILGDPTQIHQVLMNLCTNAIHATEGFGGTVSIGLTDVILDRSFTDQYPDLHPGKYLKLEVSDTGPGIRPDVISHIFEPYFTTKKPGEGTGIGLSVVHGIVKSCRGEILVESEAGKGSTFRVYLPVLKESEMVAQQPDNDHAEHDRRQAGQ